MNRLVSVIIIFYNTKVFIEEAINSVIVQTYDKWEILLIDDGSTDGSSEIAKNFSNKFADRISYYEHPNHENRGMSASRNLGIKNSKGDFIVFLDSDDVFLPEKLKEQLEIFKIHPNVTTVFGAIKIWYSWGSKSGKDLIQTLQIPTGIYKPHKLFKLFITQKAAIPGICSLMIRREIFNVIGGFENKFSGMYEDQVIYAKLAIDGINYVDSNYYELYRNHSKSAYQKSIAEGTVLKYKIEYFKWLKEYVQEKKIDDKEILSAINKEIWLCKHPALDYIHRRLLKQKRKFFPVR